ncbi:hypothetical protein E1301_Tti020631 [Triplophysa tibetana]|uniref:Uncharacterized protein n=1 Tax=Triplophysa tibetana TaxID=1572043 RepID=A0A5A9PHJ2_9TELE|nr:hypothetical protein E1301_Tti020631 [Triplophysa tibetana]
MVVAVEVSDSGIVFGNIVLILLDQNRVLLVLEKRQSVKLVDVGVHYLTREGDYICVTMPEAVVDAITAALPKLDEDRLKSLLERLLLVVGVEEVADLIYVKEDDIKDILTPLQTRKLIDFFQKRGHCNPGRCGGTTAEPRHTKAHYAWFLVKVNPEDGKKCTSRQGVSKKTGKVVQRKAVAIKTHVNRFMQSLMKFEWKTSN